MDEFKRRQVKSHKGVGCGCRICMRGLKNRGEKKKIVHKAARAKMKTDLPKEAVAQEGDETCCPICSGYPEDLGTFGNVRWFKCCDCGVEFSKASGKGLKKCQASKT